MRIAYPYPSSNDSVAILGGLSSSPHLHYERICVGRAGPLMFVAHWVLWHWHVGAGMDANNAASGRGVQWE